jgi:tape measure domain-containing protein
MAESVSFSIFLKDFASGGLAKFTSNGKKAFGDVDGAADKTRRKFEGLGTINPFKAATAGIAGYLTASQAINAVKTTAGIWGTENAIRFASGSAKEGAKSLDFLNDESERLGLNQAAMTEGFKTFQGAMMGSKFQAEQVRNMFRQVSTGAAVMNLNADDSKGVFLALGQIMSKGKVQAEELRGQIGERIPGAFQIAARAMDMTTSELDKFMSDGKLTAEEFLPRFAAQMEKEFAGGLETATNSVQSNLNRLDNSVLSLQRDFTTQFLPEIMAVVNGLRTYLIPALKSVFGWIKDGIGWVKEHSEGLSFWVSVIGSAVAAIWTVQKALAAWEAVQWAVNVAMTANPVGLVIAGIAALVAAIVWAWNKIDWFRGGIMGFWEGIKTVFTNFADMAKGVFGGFAKIVEGALSFDKSKIVEGMSQQLNAVAKYGVKIGQAAAKGYNEGVREVNGPAQSVTDTDALGKYYAQKEGDGPLGKGPGGLKLPTADPNSIKAGIAGVQADAKAARNLTVNINKLIENFTIQTTKTADSEAKIKDMVSNALLDAVRDVEYIGG